MTKKKPVKPKTRKPVDDICRVTGRMPEWMREYLADKGIEGEFSFSKLSKEQCLALDLADRLCQQEMKGLINVTYDPHINSEPQAELTDQAINTYYQKQANSYCEDANSASREIPTEKAETEENSAW